MEILLLLLLPLIAWAIIIYNKLVRDKNRVLAAWSDIDVQLKRRHDLIPKLVDAVQAYARYEQSTLDHITHLRTAASATTAPAERGRLESDLNEQLRSLLLLAEAYPDLKAGAQYLDLLQQLSDVENHIQYARRYYNGAVRNLNVRIDSFPDLLIARTFRFHPAAFFELESAVEVDPPEIR
ncbi:LemA family protein [Sedimenticola hydrogenitrophicus]|jgi:LemA protein|uniref:LemA family protein n=1 Tax=Sedimenticola hydrogenitrophicus TaxID=2967975 RepID=UPI0023B04F86|nr:LemA family protein [Sedimenticola hydrogenitrophicus]